MQPDATTGLIAAALPALGLLLLAIAHYGKAWVDRGTAKIKNATTSLETDTSAKQRQVELENLGLKYSKDLADLNLKLQMKITDDNDRFHKYEMDSEKKNSESVRIITDLRSQVEIISSNAANSRDALATAIASENETRAALDKANAINQEYSKTMQDQAVTIKDLQTQLTTANTKISELTSRVEQLEKEKSLWQSRADDRHEAMSKVQGDNLEMAARLAQHQLALASILSAVPIQNLPPNVLSELHLHNIDLSALAVDAVSYAERTKGQAAA